MKYFIYRLKKICLQADYNVYVSLVNILTSLHEHDGFIHIQKLLRA